MRITAIRATPVAVPYRYDEVWAYGRRTGQVSVLVEVDTDEGLTGLAEAAAYPSADIVLASLRTVEPLVTGADPRRIEALIHRIDLVGTWHHVRATSPAIAAVEAACWDLLGKACGEPLVNLFGGTFHDRVPFLYYVAKERPEEVAQEGARAAELGFSTCYLKVGSDDPDRDVARVAALRTGAGDAMCLRVDANEAWSTGACVQLVRRLREYRLEFVEQPVSGRNLPEMARVRERIGVPLLANEASWTRQDQLAVIRHGSADALSVDHQMDGGLLNLKRSAGLCEAAGLPVVKHSLGELGVALAASLHVLAATPNFRYANQAYGALLADDVTAGFGGPAENYSAGGLAAPTGPGLGIELDRDKVERYARLYEERGAEFAFHAPGVPTSAPALPKR